MMTTTGSGGWISRDGQLILLEKTVRTVPYGFLGVIFGVYLAQLRFTAFAIGIVLTLTVLSSAFYTFIISFLADRIGRRKTLVFFALTDFVAGNPPLVSPDRLAPLFARPRAEIAAAAGGGGRLLPRDTSRPP